MSSNTNFPAFTSNMNFNSGTIKDGGQKCSTSVWLSTHCNVKVPLTGEWYFEYITDNYVYAWMGIGRVFIGGSNHHNNDFSFTQGGEYRYNGSNQANTSNIGTGDIIGVYINNGIIKVYVNNSLDHTYSQNLSIIGDDNIYPWMVGSSNVTVNFGQDSSFLGVKTAQGNTDSNGFGDFYYTPPGNALALCSANTPIDTNIDPAETDDDHPQKQFNVLTYTGNGSTRSITGLGFQPDLIFIKARNYGSVQQVYDSTRGGNKQLYPSQSGAEADYSYLITSFDTDGWTMGNGQTDINYSSRTFCAWCFRVGGGTTSTNSEGNHDCTIQANPSAGISIMTLANYTSASGVTIGHGLGKAPSMYWHKPRTGSSKSWHVYHKSLGATKALVLDTNAAAATAVGYFADTEPTSTVLSLGNTHAGTGNGLVYAWAEIDGYSKFGTYEGTGNANGPFIDCGFRPRFLVLKNADNTDNWVMIDSEREPNNMMGEKVLLWDTTDTEFDPSAVNVDFLARGFKLRNTDNKINSSHTFVYMAWGDVPFKYNNAF